MMALSDLLKCLVILRIVAAYPIEIESKLNCTDATSGCRPSELEQESSDYMLELDSSNSLVTGINVSFLLLFIILSVSYNSSVENEAVF